MRRVRYRRNSAFSLLELVIVVVIIGIIAAIAIPRMSRGARGADESALKGDLAILRNAIDLYAAEHGGNFPSGTAAVVAAQLMERILRGCLLFAHTVLRVRVSARIELQEVSESEHPFFGVDADLLDAEPQQFTLQPETEGTARLVGAGAFISKGLSIDGIVGNPRSRIAAFVSSYKKISTRTKRLIEFDIRGSVLSDQTFYEEAFLNYYKVYESFRHLLRQRFPLEYTRLRRIKIKADQQKERANTIARLVKLSINRNVRDDDFQKKLDKIELHRDQVAAHWNFREHDDEWSLPFNAIAVASFLSHRIVLWEIEQELGDL